MYSLLNEDAKVARAHSMAVYLSCTDFVNQSVGDGALPQLPGYPDFWTSVNLPISSVGVLRSVSDLSLVHLSCLTVRSLHLTCVRRAELFSGSGFYTVMVVLRGHCLPAPTDSSDSQAIRSLNN